MAREKLKLCVFGSFNAGKTSLISALDPSSRHVEADCDGESTTVALDFGRVQVGKHQIYLFGTPGQDRFEFARTILSRGMDGAIIVVDSTAAPDRMTRELYSWLESTGLPVVFMLNKCDLPESRPSLYADAIGNASVHLISARTGENVYEALVSFVSGIVEDESEG